MHPRTLLEVEYQSVRGGRIPKILMAMKLLNTSGDKIPKYSTVSVEIKSHNTSGGKTYNICGGKIPRYVNAINKKEEEPFEKIFSTHK